MSTLVSSPVTETLFLSSLPAKNQTLPLVSTFCHSLSTFFFCSLVTAVTDCLSVDWLGPAFTLCSIAAQVSSKAAIQPAQSLPTGNRPTKERPGWGGMLSLRCFVWSGLPPPPPINNTTLPQQKEKSCPTPASLCSHLFFISLLCSSPQRLSVSAVNNKWSNALFWSKITIFTRSALKKNSDN